MKRKSTKPARKETRPRAAKKPGKKDPLIDNLLSVDDMKAVNGAGTGGQICNQCGSCSEKLR